MLAGLKGKLFGHNLSCISAGSLQKIITQLKVFISMLTAQAGLLGSFSCDTLAHIVTA